MHGVTSALFLPPLLEVISPHLRPYLLTSHFRVMVAYWISRGRYVTLNLYPMLDGGLIIRCQP